MVSSSSANRHLLGLISYLWTTALSGTASAEHLPSLSTGQFFFLVQKATGFMPEHWIPQENLEI